MICRAIGATDVGQVREHNEDALLLSDALGFYAVADGMGGHFGGHRASSLAVSTLQETLLARHDDIEAAKNATPLASSVIPQILADTVRRASNIIFAESQKDPELQGMGTTVTGIMIAQGVGFVVHVGDSRCYLRRGHTVYQLTEDHSLVHEQIKAGLLTEAQARTSKLRNIITRSVGFEQEVTIDTLSLPLEPRDRILMCSDGLTNVVDVLELGMAMEDPTIDTIPKTMIDLANARGGDDNITVVCVEVY